MKSLSSKANTKLIIAMIATFFIALLIASVQFSSFVDKELDYAINNELDGMINQQKLVINGQNQSNLYLLCSLADTISYSGFNDEETSEYLRLQKEALHFSELYYVNIDTHTSIINNELIDFHGNAVMQAVIDTNAPASALSPDSTITNGIMQLGVPVIKNNELQGVIMADNYIETVFSELSQTLEGVGYIVVTDKEGNTLVSTSDDYFTVDELINPTTSITDEQTEIEIYEDFTNGNSGMVHFTINDEPMVAKYSPLGFADMLLVLIVNENKVQTGIHLIADSVAYISIILIVLFIVFAFYIGYSKQRSIYKVEQVAYYDDLTGLPNLTKLKNDMAKILAENKDKKYAIIKVDVVNFKSINELYGFEVGNEVLCGFKKVGDAVNEESLIIARIGTDEFIFFASYDFLKNLDKQTHVYESSLKMLIPQLENHYLTFSYGRYYIEQGDTDVNTIINRVSLAHTVSKEKKDCIIWDYDDSYKEKMKDQAKIVNKTQNALKNNEFHPFLQPKIDLQTGSLVGAEALVRWIESDGSMIFPNDFIPLFERNGFIVELDLHVLDIVCATLKTWQDNGKTCVPISVNFSRLHLDNLNIVNDISDIVDKYGLDHKLIEIELTETTILENVVVLTNIINELHKRNFTISVDDFGAGYSSLGLIKDFHMDTIKLDRSFINTSSNVSRSELVIDGVVRLVHSIGSKIVAEGVEEKSQAEFLRDIQCEAAQGYYFAKPMSVADFEDKYNFS